MNRHEELIKALRINFGYDSFKGNQEEVVNSIMDGHNTFVLMPTGGGKSLCYQLPSLIMDGVAIVISPLIALMKNQVDAMRNYSEEDGIAHFINSSLSREEIDAVKADVTSGKTKLLYLAPESLQKSEYNEFLQGVKISFYAIDEAHCISEWGHDFRPEYREIRPMIERIGQAPIIALTATATEKVLDDILRNLGIAGANVFKSSFNRPNLYYEVREKGSDVDKDIIKFIRSMEGKSGIIYCIARKEVEDLARVLQVNNINALPYHAGMEPALRTSTQDAFLMERCQVIVATVAFGMGIDKPDVRFVIHYDIPKSLEGYYQETGRAGRDGGEGHCILYYDPKDLEKLRWFQKDKTEEEIGIDNQLILETQTYAESRLCRRKLLLNYFGEEYEENNCGHCDNCRKVWRMQDEVEELSIIMETIQELRERYKADYIIDIVHGANKQNIRANHHDELENYGSISDLDVNIINAIIRQAIHVGYLSIDAESCGNLHITKDGLKWLKRKTPFEVPIEVHNEDDDDMAEISACAAADEVLFSILKDMRKKLSKQMDVPPFVIFQDPSLEAMATTYPITLDELQNIPGVGVGKAKRYGPEFIRIIKEYVAENDIIRPEDMRVRTVAKDSTRKISIIQAIDRRIALDDLAESLGMSMDEMLDEIETIVYSGTKINIKYFIDEVIDADEYGDIYRYFKSAESDNLKLAIQELGEDDYDPINIRLVRIKFHSELGN